MKFILILLIFGLSSICYGTIFHNDDRRDFYEMPEEIKNISKSSVALILKEKLIKKGKY